MRILAVVVLAMVAGCSAAASDAVPAPTLASCGRTPPAPLSADKCFGEFLKDKVQAVDPHGANYVPPGCPCAIYIPFPDPDGGWVAKESE